MCYAKPGPRCSGHASKRYERASERLKKVVDEVQPELDRINAERAGEPGARRATEADLPPKLAKKIQTARGRHRAATRQFDATPAGLKVLQDRQPELARAVGRISLHCDKHLKDNYGTTDEKALKDQLRDDQEWNVLKQDRTSARSELTRANNRLSYADAYRKHDLQQFKEEKARKDIYARMEAAAKRGNAGEVGELQKELSAHHNARYSENAAELQRRKEPSITFPKAEAEDAVGKRQIRAEHSVDLAQGGKAHIDGTSYVAQTEDGRYQIVSNVNVEVIPEKEDASVLDRKGFGRGFNGVPQSHRFASRPFNTVKEAEEALSVQRKEIAYSVASSAMQRTNKAHDALTSYAILEKAKKVSMRKAKRAEQKATANA